MLQPAAHGAASAAGGFYFVASAPHDPRRRGRRPSSTSSAIAASCKRLGDACMWDASDEIRYKQPNGTVELLTSIIPIKTRRRAAGC